MLDERWSFGGAISAVKTSGATFLPGWLLISSRGAVADGWWCPDRPRPGVLVPRLEDVGAVDDRGGTYALRAAGVSTDSDHPDGAAWPQTLRVRLDPVPAPGITWIEFRGRDGTAARLLSSPRGNVHVGPLTPVAADPAERELLRHTQTLLHWSQSRLDAEMLGRLVRRSRAEILGQAEALQRAGELDPDSRVPGQIAALCEALLVKRVTDGLPVGWAGMLAGAGLRDGRLLQLDLGVTLPPVEEITLRLDTFISTADSWRLCLRAAPGWYLYGEPDEDGGRSVRAVVSVSAEDDRGGAYISTLHGNRILRRRDREPHDHEEHVLRFQPRLDPLAKALHLSFRGVAEEVPVALAVL